MQGLKIVSTGRCLPERVVTNDDMGKIVETSDEWIASRTGIRARRFCGEETQGALAVEAARLAVERAGIDPADLCACVVTTITADHIAPTTACVVQRALGLAEDMPCFDMNVGCSGFVYGLQVVRGLLLQSRKRHALLVASEALSRILDFADRGTCVLFGDGAGAVVLTLDEHAPFAGSLGARGGDEVIYIPGNGPEPIYIHMEGQQTFRFAVEVVPASIQDLLEQSGLEAGGIDWFVLHQANKRIIDHISKKLRLPPEKFYMNLDHYGNTSAASIPIALDEMAEKGLLERGQKLIFVGFGAGLTWGGTLMEW